MQVIYPGKGSQNEPGKDWDPGGVEVGRREKISSAQLFSRVRLFVTTWTAARQASLPIKHGAISGCLLQKEASV